MFCDLIHKNARNDAAYVVHLHQMLRSGSRIATRLAFDRQRQGSAVDGIASQYARGKKSVIEFLFLFVFEDLVTLDVNTEKSTVFGGEATGDCWLTPKL